MAVKHKEVDCVEQPNGTDNRLQVMLRALQQGLPQGVALMKLCETIVQSLGTIALPQNPANMASFMSDIANVQEILTNTCTGSSREELIFVTLRALYADISDPEKKPSPAMSIVLQLIEPEMIPKAVNWILSRGYPKQSLQQALSTLCGWLSTWTYTQNLGLLVLKFMKGLESQQNYDVLVDVTLQYVDRLFRLLILPSHRPNIAAVVFYMLSSMQHSPNGFHKIVPLVPTVLMSLHRENSEESLFVKQQVINLCTALMDHFTGYPDLYQPLKGLRPTANCNTILNCSSWGDVGTEISFPVKQTGKVGLNNLGNTCYMNSVLQALFMTKVFCNDVLSIADNPVLVRKLQELFVLLEHSQRIALSPNDILQLARPPGFTPGHQHDSSEFLGYLLDNLHEQQKTTLGNYCNGNESESTSTNPTSDDTAVHRSFGGKTVTVSRCDICTTQSERFDNFRELQLAFPPLAPEQMQSVQTLIEYYLQPERLWGDNQYQCDNCAKLTDGQRVTRLVELPPRLILTLKHFRFDPASQQRTKLLQRVHLDACVYLNESPYDLYAAVVHCGSSVDSGHYYTFAKDPFGSWFKFNDCSVSSSATAELCELKPPETPYILFYARRDVPEPEPLPRTQLSAHLESVLARDVAEIEAENRKKTLRRRVLMATRRDGGDDEPPPGCGGNMFDNNLSRFVY